MSRNFVFASLAAILIVSILVLGACAPAPAPAPQIVKETVVVEKR